MAAIAVLTADGSLVDVRYRYGEVAFRQMDQRAMLIKEGTDTALEPLGVKGGGLNPGASRRAGSGMVLFYNRRQIIGAGSRVTLVIGDEKLSGIVVSASRP